MAKKDVMEILMGICKPVVEEAGLELYDVEYLKEGRNWYVRIYIDKPGGEGSVTIGACEVVSRKVEALLDEKNPIEQAYILEVCSPGLDRALKKEADFARYAGSVVNIKLYKAKNRRKSFQGVLLGLRDGVVSIEDENDGVLTFERDEIAMCRLAVIF